ncbi:MAG: hypothetical protein KF726_19920 [Anaerolineae bacterium]|nr:hypothetical protein [Anaerolineae bacterium]
MEAVAYTSTTTSIDEALLKELRAEVYSNRMLISPRRLREIAHEEVAKFEAFQAADDGEIARKHGHELAMEGLGHRAVIRMTTALRRLWWSSYGSANNWSELAVCLDEYVSGVLEGYMSGREEDLKLEQQRTHDAYLRTLNN